MTKLVQEIKSLFKEEKEKEPWQIAAARYCMKNAEQSFTQKELEEYIKSEYKVSEWQLKQFFDEEIYSPAGRKYSRTHNKESWIPPLDLVAKITDFDELKEARRNAKQAFWLSVIAIIIALTTLVVAIIK